jgi:8-oxo-dGTP diphosphatase
MKVVVAVIKDKNQKVLITKRGYKSSHPGIWEFPGGKVLDNESLSSALIREIKEEVGLNILSFSFLTQVDHKYEDQLISLMVYQIYDFTGTACCLESQLNLLWIDLKELNQYKFPKANQQIINILLENEPRRVNYNNESS